MSKCPKCRAPLDTVHLSGGVDVETCPGCFGAFYEPGDLSLRLDPEPVQAAPLSCPKCSNAMSVGRLFGGKLEVEQCVACAGVWLDGGEMPRLRQLLGRDDVAGPKREPAAAPEPAGKPELGAFVAEVRKSKPDRVPAGSRDKPQEPVDCGYVENPDEHHNPSIEHEGRVYSHFQTSRPMVSYVLGEFNWKVQVGEKGVARDFICPPYLLSEDKTESDSTWSHGEYLEPEEVWRAFGFLDKEPKGMPPRRSGVAPAQPNPHAESWRGMAPAFWACAVAAVAAFVMLASAAQNKVVYTGVFPYEPGAAEKSKVTDVFEAGGHVSNLRIHTRAPVSNSWAYFAMALVNADTGDALDFGRQISYYFGYEDGEHWSEGRTWDTVDLPMVKPGRYYLRVEPESESTPFNYEITVRRDVPRVRLLFAALLALALPVLWVWKRHRSFEFQRWLESDHPMSPLIQSSEDDE